MSEPKPQKPQLELIDDGEGGATGGGITIDLKANPQKSSGAVGPVVKPDPDKSDGLGTALDNAAARGGGKLSAETGLMILRSAGLVEPAPPDPDFDWYAETGSVILNEQLSVAVYVNKQGDAVIRRQQCVYEEEDAVVVVAYENLPRVIAALQKIAKAPKQDPE